jgi:hypothetical protein
MSADLNNPSQQNEIGVFRITETVKKKKGTVQLRLFRRIIFNALLERRKRTSKFVCV